MKPGAMENGWARSGSVAYLVIGSMIVRLTILFLPFRFYRHWLGKQGISHDFAGNDRQLAVLYGTRDLVESVCNKTPWESKCLVQAILCRKLLLKQGIPTSIYLGVKENDQGGKLDAHAWVRAGSRVLTGASTCHMFRVVNVYG